MSFSTVQAVPPQHFQTTQIVTEGLEGPSGFEFAPDGRIFVLERAGTVKIVKNGQLLSTPFVTLPSVDTGDRGLIGVAFDPDYSNNHYVYFYYTGLDLLNRLVRFDASQDVATTGPVILFETKSPSHQLHVGGSIAFGPDGKLYFAVGDNGYPPNSQDLSNPHGKILRINKDGSIPTDNPFYGQSGKLWEIWAYGLRNPWRFQFDSVTGNLYVSDVGNFTWEEVNKIVKGGNYGWPTQEGWCESQCAFVNPIYSYNHDDQSSAITGGPVYRATLFPAEYRGSYFFGDYARGFIRRLTLDGAGNYTGVHDFDTAAGSVVDIKVGPDGAMYYITYYPGQLHRIGYDLGNSTPVPLAKASVLKGIEPLQVTFSSEGSYDPEGTPLTYLWKFSDGTTSTQANPVKIFNNKGTYTADLTVSDGTLSAKSIPLIIQVGIPPTLTIGQPEDGFKYRAGDMIHYTAFANDGAGFDLNDANISTTILFHHDTHTHPFMGPIIGRTGSFVVPTMNHEPDPDTHFEIIVTATDSNGLKTVKSVNVYPHKSQISFNSLFAGLKVFVDGIPVVTNSTITSVVGYVRELSAPVIQELNGKLYAFVNWVDNGPWKRTIAASDFDTSYHANFVEVDPFKAEFFNNRTLSGVPVLTRDDLSISYEWLDSAPATGVNDNNFSVRWSKTQQFAAGKYKFTTSTDDGVRLYVDGNLVIDKWQDQGLTPYQAIVDLQAGNHTIIMEYYDGFGWASAFLDWEYVSDLTIPTNGNFSASYFDNLDLAGQPKYLDNLTDLKINFHETSPNPVIPADSFSARFVKQGIFEEGLYEFKILGDDGVRVYIDGELVLDKWINQPPTLYVFTKQLTAGQHSIIVEYFENMGNGVVEFEYNKTDNPTPTPTPRPPEERYQAKYWNVAEGFTNTQVPTTQPVLERSEEFINNNWGINSPDPLVNNQNFIAQWTKNVLFESGNYEFKTISDDGIRVYLDDQVILDEWNDHAAKDVNKIVAVSAGVHKITVEYYERGGDAVAIFDFKKTNDPQPTPTPNPTDFVGEYFNNKNLLGTPVVIKNSDEINFRWGNEAPDPLLTNSNYSIRWTKKEMFSEGDYQFTVVSDDGVRLYIDGNLVLDKWINQPPTEYIINQELTSGEHIIVMEYFEDAGEAMAILSIK